MNISGRTSFGFLAASPRSPLALLAAGLLAFLGWCLPAVLLWGWVLPNALAVTTAPRFTGREHALRLAETLDKGVFQQKLISSTFVESASPGRYQLRVLLSNGAELRWDLHQVRAWAQTDSLILRGNRALVFPNQDDNYFISLDKTTFSDAALKAAVFTQHYEEDDVLAGQQIPYRVLRFHLAKLLDLPVTRDSHGYQHLYAFDYTNGQRQLLSARQAYLALQQKALHAKPPPKTPFVYRPYVLTRLVPKRLVRKNGLGRFSVELQFDQNIALQPGHYPFQLLEQKAQNRFIIQFTSPNTLLRKPLKAIKHLEFLRNIQVRPDPHTPGQALVQAILGANVLNAPPEVFVAGKKVTFSFIKVEDQSVFDLNALREADIRRQQEVAIAGQPSKAQLERRRRYQQLYTTGLSQVDSAQASKGIAKSLELQAQALVNFQKAAEQASSDDELESALLQRNLLLKTHAL